MANYYKHYEEWDRWEATGINKNTIETLLAFEISKETDFPCWEAAKILSAEKFPFDVSFLGEILIGWRKELIQHVKIT